MSKKLTHIFNVHIEIGIRLIYNCLENVISIIKESTMKLVKDILKGIIIGVANAIPGVSGGTMMVSMGIYDEIIGSLTHLFKDFKKSVMTLLPYFIGAKSM